MHHVNGVGEDAGVVYCEMQARENTGHSRSHLEFIRSMYPGKCGYKVFYGPEAYSGACQTFMMELFCEISWRHFDVNLFLKKSYVINVWQGLNSFKSQPNKMVKHT